MKNLEKYKMVDEQLAEFEKYCRSHKKTIELVAKVSEDTYNIRQDKSSD